MSPEVGATLTFGAIAVLLNVMGLRRGFFEFPTKDWNNPIRFSHLIGAFAIYFLVTFIASTVAIQWMRSNMISSYVGFSSWLNFLISALIAFGLGIYLRLLPKEVSVGVLYRSYEGHRYRDDVGAALYAWILAFPLVLFLSQMLELIIFKLFQVSQLPDQVAVKFLKSTFENPVYFVLAVMSIIVLAPLIEETLFRGFLQSFIRRHLGARQAILITSVCFSLFHYAAGQGLGNISIIFSLFVLSLYLGFLYEKQGSIVASMVLHGSFNAVSVVNLYLFGGLSTGI